MLPASVYTELDPDELQLEKKKRDLSVPIGYLHASQRVGIYLSALSGTMESISIREVSLVVCI